MIKITREYKTLKFTIDTSIGWQVTPTYERSCEMDAILLKDSIEEKLGNTIEQLRREAYEDGWRDKTKRKPKQTWFKRWI